jgi:mRNA interferase MazF
VPLSSNNKVYPPISIAIAGAGDTSVAVCDQLLAVDKSRLKQQKGRLSPEELNTLDETVSDYCWGCRF